MRLAIEQGELAKGHTYPNPPEGAVILDRDGEAVGVGATEPTGGRGGGRPGPRRELAAGGTAVVTLEPWQPRRHDPALRGCPCGRVSTVVYAVADPNPIAAGGATHLAAAGVADLFGPDSFRSYGIRASRLTDGAT